MSEEMAVNEQSSSEDAKMNGNAALPSSVVDSTESSAPPATEPSEGNPETSADQPVDNVDSEEATARKRRASSAFTDPEENEDFRGFDKSNLDDSTANYSRVLERMEEEVSAVSEALTPVRSIIATPNARARVSKRLRQDTGTDVSRPSSALSSRSDGDGVASSNDLTSSAASSPAHHKGRRPTTEMSSPLLRVPLDKGWKRELVFRAALDAYSRRNADIYYYTPAGKKLRSTREVAEHLSGTGLTLENFSFCKEPLGVDDPEKEIIRDAKLIRRLESPPVSAPAAAAAAESKRARHKTVKAATPEPPAKPKSPPPALIKVKSVGSRLSQNTPPAAKTKKQQQQQATTPTTTPTTPVVDNNNSGSWKKPRPGAAHVAQPAAHIQQQQRVRAIEPCSITCSRSEGRVPSLSCSACLCLYHPACVPHTPGTDFVCPNCHPPKPNEETPQPSVPVNKPPACNEAKPAPVKEQSKPPPEQRVTLRMKVSGSGSLGERVWAVTDTSRERPPAEAPRQVGPPETVAGRERVQVNDNRMSLPQSIALMNGKRFIVVPRNSQM